MGRPIVLLTDFGGKDHYVGVMKGVIHSLLPDPAIIDLSHEVAPQDVVSAHILLKNAYPYFPRKSIFVAVVDPGVGTGRPIIGVLNTWSDLTPCNGHLRELAEKVKAGMTTSEPGGSVLRSTMRPRVAFGAETAWSTPR